MTPNHTLNDILVWVILVWNEFLSWLPTGIVSGGLTRLPANMSAAIAGTDIWTKPTWNPKEMVLEEDRMAEICWNCGRNIRTCHFFFASTVDTPVKKSALRPAVGLGSPFFSRAHKSPTWGVLEVAEMQRFGARSDHWVSHDDAQQHRSRVARKGTIYLVPHFCCCMFVNLINESNFGWWTFCWWTFGRCNSYRSDFVANWIGSSTIMHQSSWFVKIPQENPINNSMILFTNLHL